MYIYYIYYYLYYCDILGSITQSIPMIRDQCTTHFLFREEANGTCTVSHNTFYIDVFYIAVFYIALSMHFILMHFIFMCLYIVDVFIYFTVENCKSIPHLPQAKLKSQ